MTDPYALFPYDPRPNQHEIIAAIEGVLETGADLVCESKTGSGKTICALVGTIPYALENAKRVLYITRTNSQQRQVIGELRAINRSERVFGIGLQGRANLCGLLALEPELRGATTDELSRLCSDRKRVALRIRDARVSGEAPPESKYEPCSFYDALLDMDNAKILAYAREALPTMEEWVAYADTHGCCAYELIKQLIPYATVVTAPYIYFLNRFIRRNLLYWWRIDLDEMIVVLDEAHNIPDYARELGTRELSEQTLKMAMDEANQQNDPELPNGTPMSVFFDLIMDIMAGMVEEYIEDEDALVPPDELETELMYRQHITSRVLDRIIEDLVTRGEVIREMRRKKGKLARSYIGAVGSFLQFWTTIEARYHVKLICVDEQVLLQAYCLDPSLVTGVVTDAHASVHMSGTLAPLNEYRDSVGLERSCVLAQYRSPFPEENRLTLFTRSVTTKYEAMKRDAGMVDRIAEELRSIITATARNIGVFFPSYALRDRILGTAPFEETVRSQTVYIEERGMSQDGVMRLAKRFKSGEGGLLLSVMGGRLSEGIDYPGESLEVVVIVGIPYPKPTAKQRALRHYYDVKFNRGWEYTVIAPTTRKLLQTVGRLIRDEEDRGVAVILDSRAIYFKEYFPRFFESETPAEAVRNFFAHDTTPSGT